ncbi:hypothetical protein FGD67_16570 [Colwellia sp. M166]|jgi:hypothetical protein|uniref:hypothetical protein n=1 Tax=Colwellia sp. M166 TaxID=2583805 RepID=UPI00211E38C3|nr:hypothetical protein [Colwellia sp. M166]UUO24654.1 hypothetical protein FGD67_16570 [Colwellia sp. M166]|tara:strand:+ start:3072 stop:5708 length:2637 start_codon:yes stop_codon:yes gene_type:complete
MNDVVNLIRLKRDADSAGLRELESQAKERFETMNLLLDSKWEDSYWLYLKKNQKILFEKLGSGDLPEELETLCKVFLVDVLWRQRFRSEPYSHSYITTLTNTVKIWAEMDVETLSQINQNLYDATIVYLREKYAEPETNGVLLNKTVKYLNECNLLNANVDTNVIRKVLGNADEYGRVLAKKEKMPLPELVKAIIHLKWAVDDNFDSSINAINDKLCILTQVFQFGLGLRIGEVLRLPQNPLIKMDGETFCLVWTEKGSMPMARYVPLIWRQALSEAVEIIQRITKPYRENAKLLEEQGTLGFLENRLSALVNEREELLTQRVGQLDTILQEKKQEAIKFWQLKQHVIADALYELKDLHNILPVASSSLDAVSLVKFYKTNGLEITTKPTGAKKSRHYATGTAITSMVEKLIENRAHYVTTREFLPICNSFHTTSKRSKDELINQSVESLTGRLNRATFFSEYELKSASKTAVLSRKSALDILQRYIRGGYDNKKLIPIKDLEELLPELFNQKSASKDYVKKLCGNKQFSFYKPSSGSRDFVKVKGYLADIEKVKAFFVSEYERMNYGVEKELLECAKAEYEQDGIEISSKSFSIKQHPSEYLFLRGGMRGGKFYEHLPQIMGYHAIRYFFMGNDKYDGAFRRYGIDIDNHITESWQSHKGRHWQTTSLFRSGLAELVVNKWMGRTTGQGEHYDHNTGSERAKVVGGAMLQDTERFLGAVPEKIKSWKEHDIPVSNLSQHLSDSLKSVQYSPLGYCTRDLYLKPCEFNLRCLTGNEGKGCKHYIYDLHDPSHREKISVERDRSSLELSRLFEVYERGVEAAKMHIEHHMCVLRNTTSILDNAEMILSDGQLEDLQDFMPFKKDGSYPDDCPFQCGGDE